MNLPPHLVRRNQGFLKQLEEEFMSNIEEYFTNPLDRPPEEKEYLTPPPDSPPQEKYTDSEVTYTPRDFLNELYRKKTGSDPRRLTVLDLTNDSNTISLDTVVSEEGELEVMVNSTDLSKDSINHALSTGTWDYILIDEAAVKRQIFMERGITHQRYRLAGVDIQKTQPNATLIQVVDETKDPEFPFHILYERKPNYKGELTKDYENRVKDHVMNRIDIVQETLKLAETDYAPPHIRPTLFNAAYEIAQTLNNSSAFGLAKLAREKAKQKLNKPKQR